MLRDVVFDDEMHRGEYRVKKDEFKRRLMVLQQQAILAGLGTVVIFEGWDAAGKGSRISDLVVDLDPRAYKVHTMNDPVGYEMRQPFMTRYWTRLGAHGDMTIFDQAYYGELTRSYVEDVTLRGDPELGPKQRDLVAMYAEERILEHIESARAFERQLVADGYLIVKFFLHITQEMQRERIIGLIGDASTSWKVSDADIRQMQHYHLYEKVFDRWLFGAGSEGWTVIAAEHRRNANITIMEILAQRIEQALHERGIDTTKPIALPERPDKPAVTEDGAVDEKTALQDELKRAKKNTGTADKLRSRFELVPVKSLSEVRAKNHVIDNEALYREKLSEQQERLANLSLEMYRQRIPLIIAYEGWDAAGKGGNIKRVTAAMDARSYQVQPIAAPTRDELAHPFLWRFWKKLPRSGHAAIFDRTWYGRVLVERIEGFAKKAEWERAFDEINEFENDLRVWGAVLVKLWIDVTPEEQLRRFRDREEDPGRRWKITPDDWRNRAKNDLYYRCVEDMLRLTSTEYAPWHIISSDDKHYARVRALKVINDALERRLKL